MANWTIPKAAGKRLELKRVQEGLTGTQLAKQSGVSSRTVRGIEKGQRRTFAEDSVIRICAALNIESSSLGIAELGNEAESAHVSGAKLYDVFLAAPMASIPDDYESSRSELAQIAAFLTAELNLKRVHCPGLLLKTDHEFEDEAVALTDNLQILKESKCLVAIYPGPLVSSVLVEIGIAIGIALPTIVLYRERNDLPFLLRASAHGRIRLEVLRARTTQERIRILRDHTSFLSRA